MPLMKKEKKIWMHLQELSTALIKYMQLLLKAEKTFYLKEKYPSFQPTKPSYRTKKIKKVLCVVFDRSLKIAEFM